jgi:carboxylesterase type B
MLRRHLPTNDNVCPGYTSSNPVHIYEQSNRAIPLLCGNSHRRTDRYTQMNRPVHSHESASRTPASRMKKTKAAKHNVAKHVQNRHATSRTKKTKTAKHNVAKHVQNRHATSRTPGARINSRTPASRINSRTPASRT